MSDEVQFEIGQPVQLEQIPSYKTGSKYRRVVQSRGPTGTWPVAAGDRRARAARAEIG